MREGKEASMLGKTYHSRLPLIVLDKPIHAQHVLIEKREEGIARRKGWPLAAQGASVIIESRDGMVEFDGYIAQLSVRFANRRTGPTRRLVKKRVKRRVEGYNEGSILGKSRRKRRVNDTL